MLLLLKSSRYNSGRNVLELYNSQCRSDSPQVKRNLIFSITNLEYELPNELPNDLILRMLENQKIYGKTHICVNSWPSAESPLRNSDLNSKNLRRSRYQSFLVMRNFTGFLYLVPNISFRVPVFQNVTILCKISNLMKKNKS